MDDDIIRRAETLMHYQQFRPYMLQDKLNKLTNILLRLTLVIRPNNNILTFNMLVIGLDTCAPELYCGMLESNDQIQSDSAKMALKYSIVAQLLSAAVLPTERMPICWNKRRQTIDVTGLVNSFPSQMLEVL